MSENPGEKDLADIEIVADPNFVPDVVEAEIPAELVFDLDADDDEEE